MSKYYAHAVNDDNMWQNVSNAGECRVVFMFDEKIQPLSLASSVGRA